MTRVRNWVATSAGSPHFLTGLSSVSRKSSAPMESNREEIWATSTSQPSRGPTSWACRRPRASPLGPARDLHVHRRRDQSEQPVSGQSRGGIEHGGGKGQAFFVARFQGVGPGGQLSDVVTATPVVPEPGTVALAVSGVVPLGVAGLRGRLRRRREATPARAAIAGGQPSRGPLMHSRGPLLTRRRPRGLSMEARGRRVLLPASRPSPEDEGDRAGGRGGTRGGSPPADPRPAGPREGSKHGAVQARSSCFSGSLSRE